MAFRAPRANDIWRVPDERREQAQDDATVLAIREMEQAGIDIVTDGEMRRESYSNRFALALDGIDTENPGGIAAGSRMTPVPRVVGRIRRRGPVETRDAAFLAAILIGRRRSRCPGRSHCPSRCRTNSTATRKRWRWITPSR